MFECPNCVLNVLMSEVLIECQDYRMSELDIRAADRMMQLIFKSVNCLIECLIDELNV